MNYLGELSALLTAVLWSGTSIAFSSAAEKIGSLQLNINRMIFGFGVSNIHNFYNGVWF